MAKTIKKPVEKIYDIVLGLSDQEWKYLFRITCPLVEKTRNRLIKFDKIEDEMTLGILDSVRSKIRLGLQGAMSRELNPITDNKIPDLIKHVDMMESSFEETLVLNKDEIEKAAAVKAILEKQIPMRPFVISEPSAYWNHTTWGCPCCKQKVNPFQVINFCQEPGCGQAITWKGININK